MRKEMIYSGFICIIVGSLVGLTGGATFYQWFFYVAGVGMIVWFVGTGLKNRKLESLFLACKLFTEIEGKKIVPKIISKTELAHGFEYQLSIPVGLCSADFNQKAQAFAEAYNKKVEFKYDRGKLIMKASDF